MLQGLGTGHGLVGSSPWASEMHWGAQGHSLWHSAISIQRGPDLAGLPLTPWQRGAGGQEGWGSCSCCSCSRNEQNSSPQGRNITWRDGDGERAVATQGSGRLAEQLGKPGEEERGDGPNSTAILREAAPYRFELLPCTCRAWCRRGSRVLCRVSPLPTEQLIAPMARHKRFLLGLLLRPAQVWEALFRAELLLGAPGSTGRAREPARTGRLRRA